MRSTGEAEFSGSLIRSTAVLFGEKPGAMETFGHDGFWLLTLTLQQEPERGTHSEERSPPTSCIVPRAYLFKLLPTKHRHNCLSLDQHRCYSVTWFHLILWRT